MLETMPRQMFEWGKKEGEKKGIEKGRQEGIQEGLQKGRQEGLQEGRQEGIQEGLRESILKVLQARFVSVSEFILDGICQIQNISDLEDLVTSAALVRNLEEFEVRLQSVLSRKDAKQE